MSGMDPDPTMSEPGINRFPLLASFGRAFALLARIVAIGLSLYFVGYHVVFLIPDVGLNDLLNPKYWLRIGMAVGYVVALFREFRGALIVLLCWGAYVFYDQLATDTPMYFELVLINTEWELLPIPFIVISGLLRMYIRTSQGASLNQ